MISMLIIYGKYVIKNIVRLLRGHDFKAWLNFYAMCVV